MRIAFESHLYSLIKNTCDFKCTVTYENSVPYIIYKYLISV